MQNKINYHSFTIFKEQTESVLEISFMFSYGS